LSFRERKKFILKPVDKIANNLEKRLHLLTDEAAAA
jgi:hypothetical protein